MEPLVEHERPHVCGQSPVVPPRRPAPLPQQTTTSPLVIRQPLSANGPPHARNRCHADRKRPSHALRSKIIRVTPASKYPCLTIYVGHEISSGALRGAERDTYDLASRTLVEGTDRS